MLQTSIEKIIPGIGSEYLYTLARDHERVEIRIVRRKRKTMALHVVPDRGTELRVPLKCPWYAIHDFLNQRFDWVLAALKEVESYPRSRPVVYETGGLIPYMGSELRLELHLSRWTLVEATEGELHVSCPDPYKPHLIQNHVDDWYRSNGRRIYEERIENINPLFGDKKTLKSLVVRKMKSRWGSCSSKGEVCLNLYLVREGLPQIDFVVAHELCHLRHFAHNDAFYRLLTRVMPDWRQRESLLRRI